MVSQGTLVIKNPPSNEGDARDAHAIPGSGRPLGGEPGNPLQYYYLENLMDRGAWRATVHGISKRHDRATAHSHMRARTHAHAHLEVSSRVQRPRKADSVKGIP